jgi:hypothetical protein
MLVWTLGEALYAGFFQALDKPGSTYLKNDAP